MTTTPNDILLRTALVMGRLSHEEADEVIRDHNAKVHAAGLTAPERQFLRFALDLAAEQVLSRSNEFTGDDTAALESLRRIANAHPDDAAGA